MTTGKTYEAPDWRALAEDALDLWQTHLTSLANDPHAKEEMAKMVAPMNQMFADWAGMVQNAQEKMRYPGPGTSDDASGHQDADHDSSESAAAGPGPSSGAAPATDNAIRDDGERTADVAGRGADMGAAGTNDVGHSPHAGASGDAPVTARDRDMVQLALRLATLERRFQTLETLVANLATKEIAREQQRSLEARRARREGSEAAQEQTPTATDA